MLSFRLAANTEGYALTAHQAEDPLKKESALRLAMVNKEDRGVEYFLSGKEEGELRDFLNARFMSLSD